MIEMDYANNDSGTKIYIRIPTSLCVHDLSMHSRHFHVLDRDLRVLITRR